MACITPFNVKMKDSNCRVQVPCGRCPECRARRASAWSFRLMQEDKVSDSSHFITLTYDTKHVRITKSGFLDLKKRDLQLFFKNLRYYHSSRGCSLGGKPLKYYAVGEYGGQSKRPHYHVIIFNARVELMQEAWPNGQIHYGDVSGASVGYTLKYITKPKTVPMHRNDDRLPEFSLMSKGLGISYMSDAMKRWHKNDLDNRMYCAIEDGKKISMPRYYKDKIYNSEERGHLKGVFEKLHIQKEAELIRQGEVITKHQSDQGIKAAFRKMNNSPSKTKI